MWLLVVVMLLVQCGGRELKTFVLQGDRQGTYYRVTYVAASDLDVQRGVDSLFGVIDANFNLWDKGSLIVRINDGDTAVVVSRMFEELFDRSQGVSRATDGAFDISVGALTDAWGFGADSVDVERIEGLKRSVGYEKVWIEDGRFYRGNDSIRLTMNAIAQGYTVDRLCVMLDEMGVECYLVDVGGELFGRGVKQDGTPWRVGIESPAESSEAEQRVGEVIGLRDMAVVTSGNYRKYVEREGVRYSHMIDPKTREPIGNRVLSATVYADNATDADAYATAFMVMGVERAMEWLGGHPEMEAFFIYVDEGGMVETVCTRGFRELIIER